MAVLAKRSIFAMYCLVLLDKRLFLITQCVAQVYHNLAQFRFYLNYKSAVLTSHACGLEHREPTLFIGLSFFSQARRNFVSIGHYATFLPVASRDLYFGARPVLEGRARIPCIYRHIQFCEIAGRLAAGGRNKGAGDERRRASTIGINRVA